MNSDSSSVSRSLWSTTAEPEPTFTSLSGGVRTRVGVIGGGFTGLSTALHLAEAGLSVAVLDSHAPGWGASGRNGGQVIAGLKHDPDELEEMFGMDLGARLIRSVGKAPDYLFGLIARLGIRCDALQNGWIQAGHSEASLSSLSRRAKQWRSRGVAAQILGRNEIGAMIGSDAYAGGWLDPRGGTIQPLSYARGLAAAAAARGAAIYSHSAARKISNDGSGWRIETDGGFLRADAVVLGTNAYTDDLWPGLRRSIVPTFSLQIATAPLDEAIRRTVLPQRHAVSDTLRLLRYYRMDREGRFILGARGPFRDDVGISEAARQMRHVRQIFPQLGAVHIDHVWSGQVAMTPDHLPHLHVLAPGVFAALGYNGRGVALATTMGRLLADLAAGAKPEAIDFPMTELRSIPLHGFNRIGVRILTQYYRMRDRFG